MYKRMDRTRINIVIFKLLLELVLMSACNGQESESIIIRDTTLGKVRGVEKEPVRGEMLSVEYFYGIPYAKPPVGNLRFEAPEPMQAWQPEVRDALSLHPACPQIDEDWTYIQEHRSDFGHSSEDCLYLNVFVPRLNISNSNGPEHGNASTEPLAVFVFIHGGSNVVGSANMFDGDVLAAAGEIIVVTVNYRLAVLGFLGTGHEDFPGNYGLLDIIAALRWVQDNIVFFYGDPNKVAVLGHSAGSFDVGILLVSPMAKGLFRSVICQSGPPVALLASKWPEHDPVNEVFELGKHLKCDRPSLKLVKECLKTINVTVLMKWYPMYDMGYAFPAVVGDSVVPRTPLELLKSREINANSFLIGTTLDETGRWPVEMGSSDLIYYWMTKLHILPAKVDLTDLIFLEYNGENYPKEYTTDLIIAGKAIGDAVFDARTVETLGLLSERNSSLSIYQYTFEWRSSVYPYPNFTGVTHGSDLFYLFGSPIVGHTVYNYTEEDKRMSRVMMKQWSHFVKYETFEINEENWPNPPLNENLRYDSASKLYTRFYKGDDGEPSIGLEYDLKPRETTFWTRVVPQMLNDITKALNDAAPLSTTWTTTRPTVNAQEQNDLYLILFIIFLVLSCLLLFLLMFVCVSVCNLRKNKDFNVSN